MINFKIVVNRGEEVVMEIGQCYYGGGILE